MGRFWRGMQQAGPADPRRQAFGRGLQDFGYGLMSTAGTQGFGGIGPAVAGGMQSYGDTFARATEEQRRKEEEERREAERQEDRAWQEKSRTREEERWQRTMEQWERAETEEAREKAEQEAGAAAEKERRTAMIEEIRALKGDNAARQAKLLSGDKLEKRFLDLTGDPEPKSAPTTRNFPDGSLRQWNASEGRWDVLQYEPPDSDDGSDGRRRDLTPGQLRNEAEQIANREVGTWSQFLDRAISNARARKPDIEDKPKSQLRVDHAGIRKEYTKRWNDSFNGALRQLKVDPGAAVGEPTARSPGPPTGGGAPGAPTGGGKPDPAEIARQAGLPPEVAPIIQAIGEVVPPHVANSQAFQQRMQREIESGKSPEQIARELRAAFGGGR